jgi:hypothetical protein
MALLIDFVYLVKELMILAYVVVTSPFAIMAGGLLLLGNSSL